MKIQKIGKPEIIMQNPNGSHNYFAWPSVARLKDGRIAAAASGYRLAHICPFGKAVIAYSEDEGKSYSEPKAVIDTVLDDRDAGLCPFGESGLILTSFNNTVAFQKKSGIKCEESAAYLESVSDEDERKALGSEYVISFDNGNTWSEIYHSPITSPHGPIELKDGRILWCGRVFSSNDGFYEDDRPFIRVYEMDLKGNMTEIGHIDDAPDSNFCEPYMLETKTGKLICQIRNEADFSTRQSESIDGGKTWTKARPVLKNRGGAPAHILQHSSGVLISAYGYRDMPYGVRIMLSDDDGESWQTDKILYEQDVTPDLGYPMTAEIKDKSLITVFYAHPEKGAPAVIMQQKWELV